MTNKVSVVIVTFNRKNMVIDCVDSLLRGTRIPDEIIIVDNGSTDGTADALLGRFQWFDGLKIRRGDRNLMAAPGRNIGARMAGGDYLLFVDSDNIVDKDMVAELTALADSNRSIGMVGPKMYYEGEPKRLWYAGADIDLLTSKTTYIGRDEIDEGQHDDVRETGHIPNVFLIRRKLFDKLGGFSEEYRMSYAEADLPMRVKKAGRKVLFCPKAVTCHRIPIAGETDLRNFGLESPARAYYFARNRPIYIYKHAARWQKLIFSLLFLPAFFAAFLILFLRRGQLHLIRPHIVGSWDGLLFGLLGKAKDRSRDFIEGRKRQTMVPLELALFPLLGLIAYSWVGKELVVDFFDFPFLYNRLDFLRYVFSNWEYLSGTGFPNPGLVAFLPMAVWLALTQLIGLSLGTAEALLFMIWFSVSGLAMYFLCRVLGLDRLPALVAGVFYMFNVYAVSYIWVSSLGYLQQAYMAAPLILGLYVRGIKQRLGLRWVVAANLFLLAAASSVYSNPAQALVHWIPIVTFSMFWLLKNPAGNSASYFMIFLLVWSAFNAYWLISEVSGARELKNLAGLTMGKSENQWVDGSPSAADALRLTNTRVMQGSYKGDAYAPWGGYYSDRFMSAALFLPMMLVLWGLKQRPIDLNLAFLSFLLLVSLFLVKGPNPPGSTLSWWLFKNVPFYSTIFRTTETKWGILVALAAAPLVGLGLVGLLSRLKSWFLGRTFYFPAGAMVTALFFILPLPLWTGQVIHPGGKVIPSARVKPPESYGRVKRLLGERNDSFRVMSLPLAKRQYVSFQWASGFFGTNPDKWLLGKPVIFNTQGASGSIIDRFGTATEDSYVRPAVFNLLGWLNIRYILYHADMNWDFTANRDEWFKAKPANFGALLASTAVKHLKSVDDLHLFKLKAPFRRPRIFVPKNLVYFTGSKRDLTDLVWLDDLRDGAVVVEGDRGSNKIRSLASTFISSAAPLDNRAPGSIRLRATVPLDADYEILSQVPSLQPVTLAFTNNIVRLNPVNQKLLIGTDQFAVNPLPFTLKLRTRIVDSNKIVIALADRLVPLDETDDRRLKTIFLPEGKVPLTVFTAKRAIRPLIEDPSFEKGGWGKAVDAGAGMKGKARIDAANVRDGVQGKMALQLSSSNHWAAVSRPIQDFDRNAVYRISFSYKNMQGKSSVFGLWRGGVNLTDPLVSLEKSKKWQRFQTYIRPDDLTDSLTLFLYSPSSGEKTVNRFDNVEIEKFTVDQSDVLDIVYNGAPAGKDKPIIKKIKPLAELAWQKGNFLENPSFEKGLWGRVADAAKAAPGKAKIYARQADDATDGNKSLELIAKNHWAAMSKAIEGYDPQAMYKVAFDYRSVKGKPPALGVWQSGTEKMALFQQLEKKRGWHRFQTTIKPQAGVTGLSLFFYAMSDGKQPSVARIDNVTIKKAPASVKDKFEIDSAPRTVGKTKLNRGKHRLTLLTAVGNEENLIENGDFARGAWGPVQDANKSLPGKADISAALAYPTDKSNPVLELKAQNHWAAVSMPIASVEANNSYRVSFDYRTIKGLSGEIGIWQDGVGVLKPLIKLKKSTRWRHKSFTFSPETDVRSAQLYLYAKAADGKPAVSQFDNVRVQRDIEPTKIFFRTRRNSTPALPEITFKEQGINRYVVQVKNAGRPFVLSASESFSPGWKAYVLAKGSPVNFLTMLPARPVDEKNHLKINGFANGWFMDKKGDYQIVLVYAPQTFIWWGLGLTLTAVAAGTYFLLRRQRLTHRSRGRRVG